MMKITRVAPIGLLVVGVAAACLPAAAATRHHRHVVMRAPAPVAAAQPAAAPFSFYPNEIEGGVSGNLPFNNQLRKLKDPLNANGAGR